MAIARRLFNDGATVILNSPNEADASILEQFNDEVRVRFIASDIANKSDLEKAKQRIEDEFGRLDSLVANAGVLPLPAGIDDISDENINRTIDVNLKGTFNTLKIFGSLIQETSKDGSIVALTSVDGIIGEPYGVIYSSTKAGIISLTKSFARKYKEPLIRVNAVAPGWVGTPNIYKNDRWKEAIKKIPMGRMAEPSEIAETIHFLCSEEARYIAGEVINVNGGMFMN